MSKCTGLAFLMCNASAAALCGCRDLPAAALIFKRATIAGSLIGGIKQTQEVRGSGRDARARNRVALLAQAHLTGARCELQP